MKKATLFLLAISLFYTLIGCGGNGPVAPPDGPDDGRVAGYGLLYPDKTCRWDAADFPLAIWVDDPPAAAGPFGTSMKTAAIEGIQMWNGIIDGVPVAVRHEPVEENANIYIRWEHMTLGGYTLATEFSNRIRIRKAALNEDLRDPSMIRLVAGHEIGHVLGLDLSDNPGDLMFVTVNPATTSMTIRDRDMINWLYSQSNYFPIKYE